MYTHYNIPAPPRCPPPHTNTLNIFSPQADYQSLTGGEGGRRNQARNMMPVCVRMLLQHKEEDGPLQVCGVEAGMVVMVVQVRQVVKADTNISYLV